MVTRRSLYQVLFSIMILLAIDMMLPGCLKNAPPQAPYEAGTVNLTSLRAEPGVYAPRVSWIGGYVSAVGVNLGSAARLDSSLVWLVYEAGDGIHYQPRFGQIPSGAQDLTTSFGGHPATTLTEDRIYTFWVAKDDIWNVMNASPGKVLFADTSATSVSRTSNDTLYLTSQSFLSAIEPIDVYIGIRNVRAVGRLGVIDVIQTDTSNSPLITFTIAQAGTAPPDSLLTNMGICEGQQYDVGAVIWEVLAVDVSSGQPTYWTTDVIASPVIAGHSIPSTEVFTAYPAEGLQRNKAYYIWIANKDWDQRSRLRSTYNYASATFETY
jgi:hypothetical protein